MKSIIVIGGGAAGMIAAISAKTTNPSCKVILLEKNEKLGKKIYITGKGRCNVTNAAPMDEYLNYYVSNPKFLYSAFAQFNNQDLMHLIEENGTKLKIERGNRVFPVSDHASDITKALKTALCKLSVDVRLNTEVDSIESCAYENPEEGKKDKRICSVTTKKGEKLSCDALIIATGGISYVTTGSTGDGFRFAEDLGLKVTSLRPSLVPFVLSNDETPDLEGLSLRNVMLHVSYGKKGKKEFSKLGEMVFTRRGISGPLVLTASAIVGKSLEEDGRLAASIDFKPAISEQELDQRLLKEVDKNLNRDLSNLMVSLLPSRMAEVFLEKIGIPGNLKAHDLTKEMRKTIVNGLKAYPIEIIGTEGFKQAVVTQGGVSVKEISPNSMEAKKIKGLYFAGEVLDVDGFTGGFNLQLAFSTGHLAGYSAANEVMEDK